MKNKVFTTGEVAQICGVSADTVSRWFDLNQLEGYRLGPGGDRRIPFESLRKFMLSHGIPLGRLEEGERRVLVVDDDPFYLEMIAAALSRDEDLMIYTASTGFDAGAMVVEYNPQLIILDIQLSDMDGRMVSERVRARPETQNTRILGVSGFLDEGEIQDLPSHGFDAFLKKPFQVEQLIEKTEELLGAAQV